MSLPVNDRLDSGFGATAVWFVFCVFFMFFSPYSPNTMFSGFLGLAREKISGRVLECGTRQDENAPSGT